MRQQAVLGGRSVRLFRQRGIRGTAGLSVGSHFVEVCGLNSKRPEYESNAPEHGSAAEELAYRLQQQQLTTEYASFALKTRDMQALLPLSGT
jgi:hypothetical protein